MTVGDALRVSIGPGLTFRFDLPEDLHWRVARFLHYYGGGSDPRGTEPIHVISDPPATGVRSGRILLEEPPLIVRRAGELTLFELPRIQAWCDTARGCAGICSRHPSEAELDLFIGLALAPMLIELAPSRGWLGVHAAGVSIDAHGILLPGPSGAGKSTIFTHMHRAGHGVLSDDLMWLRPMDDSPTDHSPTDHSPMNHSPMNHSPMNHSPMMYAFPRGTDDASVPRPTTDAISLRAMVCPVIVSDAESRLLPLDFSKAVEILIDQGGFLTSGTTAGDRFRALVRVAQSVPAYRLEAGPRKEETPAVLAGLATSITRQARS